MLEQALLIGLAGWRVAHLLVVEDGPFDIFEKIRQMVGIKSGEIDSFFGLLLSCMFCTTVWTCIFMYGLWLLSPTAVIVIAAMSIALMAEALNGRSEH